MRHLIRRSRGLLVALAALALTATVVFAARPATAPPPAAADGLNRAAAEAGKALPATGAQNAAPAAGASGAPESEAPESAAPENQAPNTGTPDTAPPAGTHGALVSAAAQASTPPGYDNHGAYVSFVAKQNHGATTAAAAKAAAAARANARPSH
jgi:hypothetical protein